LSDHKNWKIYVISLTIVCLFRQSIATFGQLDG
jgi:hypothetical protein